VPGGDFKKYPLQRRRSYARVSEARMKYTIAATVLVLSTTGVMADGWPELNRATAKVVFLQNPYLQGAPGVRRQQGTQSGWAAHKPMPVWTVVQREPMGDGQDICTNGQGWVEGCPVPECNYKPECTDSKYNKYVVTHDDEGNPLPTAHRPAPEELDGKVIQCTQGQLWENGECH
jgi:hypothetical protein